MVNLHDMMIGAKILPASDQLSTISIELLACLREMVSELVSMWEMVRDGEWGCAAEGFMFPPKPLNWVPTSPRSCGGLGGRWKDLKTLCRHRLSQIFLHRSWWQNSSLGPVKQHSEKISSKNHKTMKIYFFKFNVFIKFNLFKATFPFPGDGLGKRNVPTGRSYITQWSHGYLNS